MMVVLIVAEGDFETKQECILWIVEKLNLNVRKTKKSAKKLIFE